MAGPDAVNIHSLQFAFPGHPPILKGLNLSIPQGSRVLLVGANGSGKTMLLQVLAGQYMVGNNEIRILGKDPFSDLQMTNSGELAFLGNKWRRNVAFAGYDLPLQGDISAKQMIFGVEGVDPKRREKLLSLLEVDLNWRMHLVSDGQRRRVQICLGLLKPYKVLLLDEITVDMDVIGRLDLLQFLKEECETREATIIYATHIFDGLQPWITHVAYIEDGCFEKSGEIRDIMVKEIQGKSLMRVVEGWLKKWQERRMTSGREEETERQETLQSSAQIFPSKHMAFFR